MKHVGSIIELNGAEIETVDCITGGSPCQDLSIAGKRNGLAGERSGLFMEQIRLVKEMREHDRATGRAGINIRPRWMVWENVAGAFSSPGKVNGEDHRGEDFQAVLTEIVRIAEPDAPDVPMPQKRNWPHAGELHDELGTWSIAWRLVDAQYWGTPQRRKRIALVADFNGGEAAKVLFEQYQGNEPGSEIQPFSEGMPGNSKQSKEPREGTTGKIEISTPSASAFYDIRISSEGTKNQRAHCYETEINRALDTGGGNPDSNHGGVAVIEPTYCLQGNGIDRSDKAGCEGKRWTEEVSYTLNTMDRHAIACGTEQAYTMAMDITPKVDNEGIAYTLRSRDCKDPPVLFFDEMIIEPRTQDGVPRIYSEVTPTLNTAQGGQRQPCVLEKKVRRITPMEAERLQGYPDGWTDIGEWTDSKGKIHKGDSDTPRYKALGNSIAIPFWFWLLRRISGTYTRRATLGSLFDGIGGFPFCWEMCNGKGTARWASEIEEFPIAVTKKHFPE